MISNYASSYIMIWSINLALSPACLRHNKNHLLEWREMMEFSSSRILINLYLHIHTKEFKLVSALALFNKLMLQLKSLEKGKRKALLFLTISCQYFDTLITQPLCPFIMAHKTLMAQENIFSDKALLLHCLWKMFYCTRPYFALHVEKFGKNSNNKNHLASFSCLLSCGYGEQKMPHYKWRLCLKKCLISGTFFGV